MYPKTSAGNTRPIAASSSSVAQTRRYKFVLIYNRQTHRTKLWSFGKRASPLSPGTRECVCLVPKNWDADACNLRHRLVQFCLCTRIPSKIQDLYKSISMPDSQSTPFEAVSMQVNALYSTCWPLTLTFHSPIKSMATSSQGAIRTYCLGKRP